MLNNHRTSLKMNGTPPADDNRTRSGLFASSFRLLYASRERIWSDPLLYGADVGVSTYGNNGKVGLGAVLHAVDAHPDLFRVGDARIISFYGSPLSGATVNRAVDLRTGRVFTVKGQGFISKIRALNAAAAFYPKSGDALPLGEVIGLLGEVCR